MVSFTFRSVLLNPYQQRARVQASLVLCAVEICAPQFEHCSVIPPNKPTNGALKQVSHNHESPKFVSSIDVLWCEFHKRWYVVPLLVKWRSSNNVDRDQDTTADYREHRKYVSNHPKEPHEEYGV